MRLVGVAIVVMSTGWAAIAYAGSDRVQTVTTARVVEAARTALPAARPGSTVTARVLGAPPDTNVPAGAVSLQTRPVVGRWPRARVAVPVVVLLNDKPVRTETVWFAVNVLRLAWVYDEDTPVGTASSRLKAHQETIDVAQADGRPVDLLATLANDRLKRGVHAGWPLLAGDFEPIPDVDKQGRVTVHVRYGSIRMEAMAKALRAGEIGDVVPVLVDGAASPVLATVTGKGAVDIAH